MYKRPTIRARRACAAVPKPVPPGFPSVVGRLVDGLRATQVSARPKPWVPSIEYEFIASHMHPDDREAYIKQSREWFEANPSAARAVKATEKPVIDHSHILDAIAKRARVTGQPGRPPPNEMAKAMRAGGYPEIRVSRYLQWCQNMEDTSDERQEVIDKVFAKYPSASKPDPKPKTKKVIKAVKKRMGNEQASQDGMGGHD